MSARCLQVIPFSTAFFKDLPASRILQGRGRADRLVDIGYACFDVVKGHPFLLPRLAWGRHQGHLGRGWPGWRSRAYDRLRVGLIRDRLGRLEPVPEVVGTAMRSPGRGDLGSGRAEIFMDLPGMRS
jgi:hypothetical protein